MRVAKSILLASRLALSLLFWGGKEAVYAQTLLFDRTEVNQLLISADDAPRDFPFPFQNVSNDTVWITEVITSCSCTKAYFGQTPLAPGERGEIILNYNPYLKSGKLFQQAFVYTNRLEQVEEVLLSLEGEVTPTTNCYAGFSHRIGKLGLKRTSLSLRFKAEQFVSSETILCVNGADSVVKLTTDIYPFLKLYTVPTEIAAGEEADLVVTVDKREWKKILGDQTKLLLPVRGAGEEGELEIELLLLE